jgi:hypothetical protein
MLEALVALARRAQQHDPKGVDIYGEVVSSRPLSFVRGCSQAFNLAIGSSSVPPCCGMEASSL